ncbi:MAG: ATP-binding protein [Candidatus Electryonea clarkiae]|nr:ATP-binding protein [Candidatus Electryonea clarkiae]
MFTDLRLENSALFKDFEWKNHDKLNVIIGENDTGKTHLLKIMYSIAKSIEEFKIRQKTDKPLWKQALASKLLWVFQPGSTGDWHLGELVRKGEKRLEVEAHFCNNNLHFSFGKDTKKTIKNCTEVIQIQEKTNSLFLPPKEVLTSIDAIYKVHDIPGFDHTYQDLITAIRKVPSKSRGALDNNAPFGVQPFGVAPWGVVSKKTRSTLHLNKVIEEILSLFRGEIKLEKDHFVFSRKQEKYQMSQIAEGIKKLSMLTLLIKNQSLRKGSILFIDEPETNLHPGAIKKFMTMLYHFSMAGIQIYLATHSYFVIKQLELIARKNQFDIPICSLNNEEGNVTHSINNLRDGVPDNPIIDVSIEQFEEDLRMGED